MSNKQNDIYEESKKEAEEEVLQDQIRNFRYNPVTAQYNECKCIQTLPDGDWDTTQCKIH